MTVSEQQPKHHFYSLHIFDEREFRYRFLPALQGEEPIVRELLEAANASGPSWTALHKMFDETRPLWLQAMEAQDGAAAQRTGFASFARLQGHLRPAYVLRDVSLSHIDRASFPELTSFVKSPGVLLVNEEGEPLAGIPANMPSRIPGRCQGTRSGGGVVLKEDVRTFLQALRGDLPRLADHFSRQGLPAEEAVTLLLAVAVQAKLKGAAIFEAVDALTEDTFLPNDHQLTFAQADGRVPLAVRREAGRVFGKTLAAPAPAPAAPARAAAAPADYSPQQSYSVGQRIKHKSFGEGEVTRVLDSRRLQVRFASEEKTLVQGLSARIAQVPSDGDGADSDSDSSDDED
ncbi:MAG: hypothetical protein AB7N76_08080 [Planctomycetota bacterium]